MQVPLPPDWERLFQTVRDIAETTKVVVELLWWIIRLVSLFS